jgi:hypothetical protein
MRRGRWRAQSPTEKRPILARPNALNTPLNHCVRVCVCVCTKGRGGRTCSHIFQLNAAKPWASYARQLALRSNTVEWDENTKTETNKQNSEFSYYSRCPRRELCRGKSVDLYMCLSGHSPDCSAG